MSKKRKNDETEHALQRSSSSHHMGLFDEFERALFNRGFPFGWLTHPDRWGWPGDAALSPLRGQVPAVDVIDRESDVLVRAEVPGVVKEDLDVSVTENSVSIRGHSKREEEEQKGDYFRRETSYGEFSRTVPLPANVDTEGAKAKFKDGVLEITLPKQESTKRKSVEVETG